jgi:hypothetical protein
MAIVETRVRMRIDQDNRRVLSLLKSKYGYKTDSEAINHALRIQGVNIHIQDVGETKELLERAIELLQSVPNNIDKINSDLKLNEAILMRTFALLRRMIYEFDQENKTVWLDAGEDDFKAHIKAKQQR